MGLDARARRRRRRLNLFGYTGVGTLLLSRPARGWSMSMRRRSRSRAAGPMRPVGHGRPARSAGSSTMPPSSPRARCGADGAMTASCSTRPSSGAGRRARCGGWRSISRRLLADCRRLLDADSRFLVLTVYAVRMSALAIGELVARCWPISAARSNAAKWRCAKRRADCCCRPRSSRAGPRLGPGRPDRRARDERRAGDQQQATAASSLSAELSRRRSPPRRRSPAALRAALAAGRRAPRRAADRR